LAQVILGERARSNLERLVEFLATEDPVAGAQVFDLILDALTVLERHPQIGRPAEEELRELVISRGRSGYVALYQYREADDLVVVLALRHQREAGYPDR
jgi:plasmid stabilization system protein ParE